MAWNSRNIGDSLRPLTTRTIWVDQIDGFHGNNPWYHLGMAGKGMNRAMQKVDGAKNIVNSYNYNAWGEIREENETATNPFLWQTKPWDQEVTLYYSRARYYEGKTGRFLGVDPDLRNPRYAWPISPSFTTDPTGHGPMLIPLVLLGWKTFWTSKAVSDAILAGMYGNSCFQCYQKCWKRIEYAVNELRERGADEDDILCFRRKDPAASCDECLGICDEAGDRLIKTAIDLMFGQVVPYGIKRVKPPLKSLSPL